MRGELESGKRMKDVLYAACPNEPGEPPVDAVARLINDSGCTPSELLDLVLIGTDIDQSDGLKIWLLIVLFGVFGNVIEEGSLDV